MVVLLRLPTRWTKQRWPCRRSTPTARNVLVAKKRSPMEACSGPHNTSVDGNRLQGGGAHVPSTSVRGSDGEAHVEAHVSSSLVGGSLGTPTEEHTHSGAVASRTEHPVPLLKAASLGSTNHRSRRARVWLSGFCSCRRGIVSYRNIAISWRRGHSGVRAGRRPTLGCASDGHDHVLEVGAVQRGQRRES